MVAVLDAAKIRHQHNMDTAQGPSLPSILGRLSKLENEGLSYNQLEDSLVTRRRIGPLNIKRDESTDGPVQQPDEIVQVQDGTKIGTGPFSMHVESCNLQPRLESRGIPLEAPCCDSPSYTGVPFAYSRKDP